MPKTKRFKSGDRVQFNQAFRSDFAEQLKGVTEAELTGTVQFYSETGKLVILCDWKSVVEAEDEKYFDLVLMATIAIEYSQACDACGEAMDDPDEMICDSCKAKAKRGAQS